MVMRLFASTTPTPRGIGGRDRCSSARPSSHPRRHANNPPSPLAQQLTKRKIASAAPKKSARRSRNAIHPIDLRDLETELELLPDSDVRADAPVCVAVSDAPDTTSYTVTISVLHALDLHNPCQIRSCPHAFAPRVQLSIDGQPLEGLDAARHAKNHSSWSKDARITHHITSDKTTRLHTLRVNVEAHCTRHSDLPELIIIGHSDDIVLPLDPSRVAVSQFHPIFRYQHVKNQPIKYFAGKIKLAISATPDAPLIPSIPVAEIESVEVTCSKPSSPQDLSGTEPAARRPFLPANFGDALQLKRKQLKATIAPEVVNHAICKANDDPKQTQELMDRLLARANRHLIRLSDVHILEATGEGVHASVFRARVDGIAIDVAVKEFRYELSATGAIPPLGVLRAFEQEYEMLSLVSSNEPINEEKIIQLVGVMLTPRLAIFTDYCIDGSLARCLANNGIWSRVSMEKKLVLGSQIAEGLAELHRLNIVHRDIKSHNIMIHGLLSERPIAKIGDLGSAVTRLPADALLHEETGSSGYTAPEVFRSTGYDHRADIWGLGIVLWELLLGGSHSEDVHALANPYLGVCGDEVVHKVERGQRPFIPVSSLPAPCETLLRNCWELDPAKRPTALEIATELKNLSGLASIP